MLAVDLDRSRVTLGIKRRLYNTSTLPIFLYDAETLVVTTTLAKTFDVLYK